MNDNYPKIKNVIFDWSGTLSNDFDMAYNAAVLIFKKMNHEPISRDTFKREMRQPYMDFWNDYFPNLTQEKQDEMFKEATSKVKQPTIYPGVKDELERLQAKGVNRIVISSFLDEKVKKNAEDYEVKHLFQEITGSIPNKEGAIEEIIERNNFNPEETAYVGDMPHDIKAGKKAGVITVGISWGYKPADILAEEGPDYIIDDIKELKSVV